MQHAFGARPGHQFITTLDPQWITPGRNHGLFQALISICWQTAVSTQSLALKSSKTILVLYSRLRLAPVSHAFFVNGTTCNAGILFGRRTTGQYDKPTEGLSIKSALSILIKNPPERVFY